MADSAALYAPRRSKTDRGSHEEAQIQRTYMNQHSLQNIASSPQVRSPHSSRSIEVCEGALKPFASRTEQCLPSFSAHPATVTIDCALRFLVSAPAASLLFRFRDVRSQPELLEILDPFSAVIPFVGDKFLNAFALRQRSLNLFGGRNERLGHGARVALISTLDGNSDDNTSLKVDRLFGFMSKVGAASFILVIRASGSLGFFRSLLETFFFLLRSSRARSSRVGVGMPDSFARAVRNS